MLTPKATRTSLSVRQKRYPTLQKFKQWQPNGYKYDWVSGSMERKESMKNTDRYMTKTYCGNFRVKKPVKTAMNYCPNTMRLSNKQARIPKMSYFISQQIAASAKPFPTWVIEII